METTKRAVINTQEACKLLKMSRPTLYKLVDKGELPGKKVGKNYKFNMEDILRFVSHEKGMPIDGANIPDEGFSWTLRENFATEGIKKMAKKTFQEFSSNVEELIVNAYDGDATKVEIIVDLDKKEMAIHDDGNGMDTQELNTFVVYGESQKSAEYRSPQFGRKQIGYYGMGGKLAIANLCKLCKIVTKKSGLEHVFNMDKSQLDRAKYITDVRRDVLTKKCDKTLHGTSIYMSNLLYKRIDENRLIEKLSERMPRSQKFRIFVTIKKDNAEKRIEIEEPKFDIEREFPFEADLKLIGHVDLKVYFAKIPIPAPKQGIWTKVNGRVVNEKQEWFGLLSRTSGTRYKYRLYGIANADGLSTYVNFAKNDFIDCPEYKEYYEWAYNCLGKVQRTLLKADEDAKKESQRNIVKEAEKEVNEVVSRFDTPAMLQELKKTIKVEAPKQIEKEEYQEKYKDKDTEDVVDDLKKTIDESKKRRENRKKKIKPKDKVVHGDKSYIIDTVDMSEKGDLIRFTNEQNLIEINEKHPLYISAGNRDYLDCFVKDLAYMEVARDISDGNDIIFDEVFNKLIKLSLEK